MYLEACNMSYRRSVLELTGGFDEGYAGIGDWSEPDLSLRVREYGRLWFTQAAAMTHLPDQTGAYLKRAQVGARLTNYWRFAERWVEPCFSHWLYRQFLRTYYGIKEVKGWAI